MYLSNFVNEFLSAIPGRTICIALGSFNYLTKMANLSENKAICGIRIQSGTADKAYTLRGLKEFDLTAADRSKLSLRYWRLIQDESVARLILHLDVSAIAEDELLIKEAQQLTKKANNYQFLFTTGANVKGFRVVPYSVWAHFFFNGFNVSKDPHFKKVIGRIARYADREGITAYERAYLRNLVTLTNLIGV
jgi:hypothetical protein